MEIWHHMRKLANLFTELSASPSNETNKTAQIKGDFSDEVTFLLKFSVLLSSSF